MKTISCFFTLFAAVFSLAACRQEAPSPSPATFSPATLTLGFGSHHGSAKSFAPEAIAVSSINIEGAGPGGARASASSADFSPVRLELAPGSWVITAKGMNSNGVEVASGFLELDLEPSQLLARDMFLAPVAGDGSVSLSWTLTGSVSGVLSVEGALTSSSGTVLPIASPFSPVGGGPLRFEGLLNGSWTLEIRLLRDGAAVCGLADGVLVAAGMETQLSVSFRPPEAALSLGFVLPDYAALALQIEPGVRRVSPGTVQRFRTQAPGSLSWYVEGTTVGDSGNELVYTPGIGIGPGVRRVDCVLGGSSLPRSGSAEARMCAGQGLGRVTWGELVCKAEGSAASQAAKRALGDCRDLAWSADGSFLAAVGKETNALSVLEAPAPGTVFALASLGGTAAPGFVSPSILRHLPGQSLLAFSDSQGSACSFAHGPIGCLYLTSTLTDACLAGARDAVVPADASCAYVAASGTDAVAVVTLGPFGDILAAGVAAAMRSGGMATFSRPYCLALSPDGSLLAVGTAGDDAIYFLDRDASTNALSFRSRVDKTAFPAEGPLSDPCSLAFSPDASSLFVLSYYGKAVIRLDRNPASGLFVPATSRKSGLGGVQGFAYPKRLCLSPDGTLLAVIGSGTGDGLALFGVGPADQFGFLGSILPSEGSAVPNKPLAIAFSPNGSVLAIASDGYLSLFNVAPM